MTKVKNWAQQFYARLRSDEKGAALVEYTVLLGVICAVAILTIVSVGTQAVLIWSAVLGQLVLAVAAI